MSDTPLQAALRAAFAVKAPKKSPVFSGIPTAPTAEKGTNTDQIATTAFVNDAVSSGGAGCPTGMIAFFHATTPPEGWLPCNGQNVSRTTYANLFAVIGTTYGSGDGSTTFKLPNLHHRFLEGTTTASEVGDYVEAGLPNITSVNTVENEIGGWSSSDSNLSRGALYTTRANQGPRHQSSYRTGWYHMISLDASRSSSSFGRSTSVQPPSARLLVLIKT